MITTTRLVTPRFSGVHRGPAPDGDNSKQTFYYYNPQTNTTSTYHTSGQDTLTLKTAIREQAAEQAAANRDRVRDQVIRVSGPATHALQHLRAAFVEKEPNNQFQSALTRQKPSDVLDLLGNPEVQLSESDAPGSVNLPERLLGNEANFNHFSQALGGDKQAKSFITRVLAREIKSDLASGFQSGNWKEQSVESRNRLVPKAFTNKRDDKDLDKSALKLAREAVKEYRA